MLYLLSLVTGTKFLEYTNFSKKLLNEEFLRLILNSLHFITKNKKFPPLIKAITEFRIAVISGYLPDLLACENCGKFEDDVIFFNMSEGSLICKDCTDRLDGLTTLDRTSLSALRHIAYSEFSKLYSLKAVIYSFI